VYLSATVVDTGFVKTRFIAPTTGVEMLRVMPVSKFQANQRTGRAGRTSAGKCFRVYTEESFEQLPSAPIPEIQRTNIAQVLLQLKELGVESPSSYPFISPPSALSMRKAFECLLMLGAIGKDQALTPHGKQMASLPLEPTFAHLLLKSQSLGCVAEALTAVSLLSADNIFLQVSTLYPYSCSCAIPYSFPFF
jgi:HrpA-like RNA helicase